MTKDDPRKDGGIKPADNNKKTYLKPRILSVEKLEVVAATCGNGKAVFTGADHCGTDGPINS